MSEATDLIRRMPEAFDPNAAGDMQMTVQYAISDPMYSVIDNGECSVHEGEASEPDVTITMEDSDLVDLMTGQLNGTTAFITGKLKVAGDIMQAQKLPSVFDRNRLS